MWSVCVPCLIVVCIGCAAGSVGIWWLCPAGFCYRCPPSVPPPHTPWRLFQSLILIFVQKSFCLHSFLPNMRIKCQFVLVKEPKLLETYRCVKGCSDIWSPYNIHWCRPLHSVCDQCCQPAVQCWRVLESIATAALQHQTTSARTTNLIRYE